MTNEQLRTLTHYLDRYEQEVRQSRRHGMTTADWRRLDAARADYLGYRRWLERYAVRNREAAA